MAAISEVSPCVERYRSRSLHLETNSSLIIHISKYYSTMLYFDKGINEPLDGNKRSLEELYIKSEREILHHHVLVVI